MSLAYSGSISDPQILKTRLNSHALACEPINTYRLSDCISSSALCTMRTTAREALSSATAAASSESFDDDIETDRFNIVTKLGYGMMLLSLMLCAGLLIFLTAFLAVNLIPAAHASSAGSGAALPYEVWLTALQKSATGPIAFTVSLLGIIGSGATLIFTGGEISRFMRSIIYIVLVMTLLLGANSLMTNFFNGAAITPPAAGFKSPSTTSAPTETDGSTTDTAAARSSTNNSDAQAPKKLKPSVFGNQPLANTGLEHSGRDEDAASADSEQLFSDAERQALELFEDKLLSLNPDLTYDEHVQHFISGLLNESEAEAQIRADNAKRRHAHVQPSAYSDDADESVFSLTIREACPYMLERTSAAVPRTYHYVTNTGTTVFSTFPVAEDTEAVREALDALFADSHAEIPYILSREMYLSKEQEPYNINSYQLSPLPLKNNAETLQFIQSGNAEFEYQLFEFSNRTLKGLLPSHLDLNDSRLS